MNTTQNNKNQPKTTTKRPFVIIPKDIRDSSIDVYSFRVWARLLNRLEDEDELTIEKIAKQTLMSRSQVKRSLSYLVDVGLVEKIRGYKNKYIAKGGIDDDDWDQRGDEILNRIKETRVLTEPKNGSVRTKERSSQNQRTVLTEPKMPCSCIEGKNNKNNKNIRMHDHPPTSDQKLITAPPTKSKADTAKAKSEKIAKYENEDMEFARSWLNWTKERGSHHGTTASKSKWAAVLAKLRRKYGFRGVSLPKLKELAVRDKFWADKLFTPCTLEKSWGDGPKISYLIDALTKLDQDRSANEFVDSLNKDYWDEISNKMGCNGEGKVIDLYPNKSEPF